MAISLPGRKSTPTPKPKQGDRSSVSGIAPHERPLSLDPVDLHRSPAHEDRVPRTLDWYDLYLAVSMTPGSFRVWREGFTALYFLERLPEYGKETLQMVAWGLSMAPVQNLPGSNMTTKAAMMEPLSRDGLRAIIEEAATPPSRAARSKTTREVAHGYTLSGILDALRADDVELVARGSSVVAAFPAGEGHPLSVAGFRHALQVLEPLLTAHALGTPAVCDEPDCGALAESIVFPVYAVCEAHLGMVVVEGTKPPAGAWWRSTYPAVSCSREAVDELGLASPPDDYWITEEPSSPRWSMVYALRG